VDAGGRAGSGDPERFALDLNVAAAHEAARQIRLRGLGGVIAIDFVSLRSKGHNKQLEEAVRAAFAGHLIGTFNDKAGRPVNFGPEDVAVSPRDGRIYTGLGDGRILRIDPRGGPVEVFANTGGRPLGVTFDTTGERLYVSDALLGLLSVDLEGRVTVLADEAQGEPVTFADNLDVARDGTVWFSAPTRDHSLAEVELDVWDSRPSGRLLRYRKPHTVKGQTPWGTEKLPNSQRPAVISVRRAATETFRVVS
jgi:hypothetical protein